MSSHKKHLKKRLNVRINIHLSLAATNTSERPGLIFSLLPYHLQSVAPECLGQKLSLPGLIYTGLESWDKNQELCMMRVLESNASVTSVVQLWPCQKGLAT